MMLGGLSKEERAVLPPGFLQSDGHSDSLHGQSGPARLLYWNLQASRLLFPSLQSAGSKVSRREVGFFRLRRTLVADSWAKTQGNLGQIDRQ